MKRSRQARHNNQYQSAYESWWDRRRHGFGMNLYRNRRDKRIAGVCAGLADHFNLEPWVVRLLAVAGLIFLNSLMIFAYIGAWIVLAPRPKLSTRLKARVSYDERLHEDRPVNMFRYQSNPEERLKTAQKRMEDIVKRAERMEQYVTSKRFEIDKEFSKIQ